MSVRPVNGASGPLPLKKARRYAYRNSLKTKNREKPVDVFLSFAEADTDLAERAASSFESAGLRVFAVSGLGDNSDQTAEVRRHLRENLAFVAILTPTLAHDDALAIEIGAAWAGSTPIYLLLSEMRNAELPNYLRRYSAAPLGSALKGVVREILELKRFRNRAG
jgi:hypothetical protein